MCLLFETIRIEKGKLQNVSFHNERLNRSRKELFGIDMLFDLQKIIHVPDSFYAEKHRCRIVYSTEIISIAFSQYTMRKINNLKIVEDDTIEYAYKFEDRQVIEKLRTGCKADDILIIKNGLVSDTSYANIVFWDGIKWVTPSSPLLRGTTLTRLLLENKIQMEEIRKSDIKLFKSARIINAMIGLEESPSIEIKNIF
ncbi:MAG: aminotransferase class IV [Bacteroidales bacterium]